MKNKTVEVDKRSALPLDNANCLPSFLQLPQPYSQHQPTPQRQTTKLTVFCSIRLKCSIWKISIIFHPLSLRLAYFDKTGSRNHHNLTQNPLDDPMGFNLFLFHDRMDAKNMEDDQDFLINQIWTVERRRGEREKDIASSWSPFIILQCNLQRGLKLCCSILLE